MCISRNYTSSGQVSLPFLTSQTNNHDDESSSLSLHDMTVSSCLLDLHLLAEQQRSRCLPFSAPSEDNSFLGSNTPKSLRKVQHDYHDYGSMIDDGSSMTEPVVVRGGVTSPFPIKLHEMLDDIERDGYGHVVSWQPHGRCFVVRKPKEFVEHVMPTYFKQSKLASFQRQLNLYGFQRLTRKGPDKGGYYHEKFLRGKVFLAQYIQRNRVKGTCVRARSNPDDEPDFERMPPIVVSDVVSEISCPQNSYDSSSDLYLATEKSFSASPIRSLAQELMTTAECISCVTPPNMEMFEDESDSLLTESECGNFEGMKFHLLDTDCINQLLVDSLCMNTNFAVDQRMNLSRIDSNDEDLDAENMESVFQLLNIPKDIYFDVQGTGIDDEEKFGMLMQRIIK
jgi:hypothetical protein